MTEPRTWRELLGSFIDTPEERERIASASGVNPVTLLRWARGERNPRMGNLLQLLQALPQHRTLLFNLMAKEFPEIAQAAGRPESDENTHDLPSTFYARLFRLYSTVPRLQLFWGICHLIFQHAIELLDPEQSGLSVTLFQCTMPGPEKKVRSLRLRAGQGTSPWPQYLEHHMTYLSGTESLEGYVVATGHALIVQSPDQQGVFPLRWFKGVQSVAAYPLSVSDLCAGCMVFASTQADYFLPYRQRLMEQYASLMILAFRQEEFFPLHDIDLRPFPRYEQQVRYLYNFRQRLLAMLNEARLQQQPLTSIQVEELLWQQVEQELLQSHALYLEEEDA